MTNSRSIQTDNINAGNANIGGTQTFYAPIYFGSHLIQRAPEPDSKKIFLSYARADDHADYHDPAKSFLRRLYNALKDDYTVWWDREAMPSRGRTFDDEIKEAITTSSRVLLVVGDGVHDSEYVQMELDYALSRCIPVIPLLRHGDFATIPDAVPQVHALDFRRDDSFATEIKQLRRILGDPDTPPGTLYGVPPLPDEYIEREILAQVRGKLLADTDAPLVVTSAREQMLTVYGVGGIGKTILAAALSRMCEVRRRFPDGVFFIEMGKTPELLQRMADVGAMFGDDRQQYIDRKTASQRLSAILDGKQALLVLDDIWNHTHAQAFQVVDTRCRLLITTRQGGLVTRLNAQGAQLLTLTEAEGLRLIAGRVGTSPDDLPDACKQIIALVDGHTLAVSLAAAQLHERGLEYAARLLERLQKGRTFDDKTLSLAPDDKNFNLELCLRLSYDDLSDDLQRRFRLCGILADDSTFDEPLAQALWNDEDDEFVTDDALTDLVRAGLLRREADNRYAQHGLLRAYARALLDDAGETDAAFRRYADHMTEVANQFRELPLEQWRTLEDQQPHIHHVGDTLSEKYKTRSDLYDMALQFAYNTTKYVSQRPQTHRLHWLEMGLSVSQTEKNKRRESLFLNELGFYYSNRGNKQKALAFYNQALPIQREVGDKAGEATTLTNIGSAWDSLGEFRRALDFYNQALPLRREVGDKSGEATTLNNIGSAWSSLGEVRRALAFYNQALPLRREVGDKSGEATTLSNIGQVHRSLGNPRRALDFYNQALPLRREVGDKAGEAATLSNISYIYFQNDELEKTIDIQKQIIEIVQQTGAVADEASFRLNIAVVYQKMGRIDDAIAQAERGREILVTHDLPYNAGGSSVEDYDRFLAKFRKQQGDNSWLTRIINRLF